jgi:hypothetical protein
MRTNSEKVVKISVAGIIKHPRIPSKFEVQRDGSVDTLPGTGGIVYNVRLGDSVYDWAGDHVEPGVSVFNPKEDEGGAFSILSCLGNKARVLTGDAKGAIGFVSGQHGGVQHVMCIFHDEDMKKLAVDDRVQIEAYGMGLKLLDYPDVFVHVIDPGVFECIPIEERDNQLHVPVAGVIPWSLIGSGYGDTDKLRGRDCDLMASEWDAIVENGLQNLKFGDLVLIKDLDSRYGRSYRRGAATVGVIIHGDSPLAGHGPGIATFLTSEAQRLVPVLDETSNIAKYHELAYGPLKPLS